MDTYHNWFLYSVVLSEETFLSLSFIVLLWLQYYSNSWTREYPGCYFNIDSCNNVRFCNYQTKRRAGRTAPRGSGMPIGYKLNWYIKAHQYAVKTGPNTYKLIMKGKKYLAGYKKNKDKKWREGIKKEIKEELNWTGEDKEKWEAIKNNREERNSEIESRKIKMGQEKKLRLTTKRWKDELENLIERYAPTGKEKESLQNQCSDI